MNLNLQQHPKQTQKQKKIPIKNQKSKRRKRPHRRKRRKKKGLMKRPVQVGKMTRRMKESRLLIGKKWSLITEPWAN